MCDKTHFCGPCANAQVEAWAEGTNHQIPQFGDRAQRDLAVSKRVAAIAVHLQRDELDALNRFPELGVRGRIETRADYDALLGTVAQPPRFGRASRRGKHRHTVELRRWHMNHGPLLEVVKRYAHEYAR